MDKINKYQTGVILLAVFSGLVLGQMEATAHFSAHLIVPLLMLMLFGLFLTIDLRELQRSFRNVKFSLTSLAINFVWTPIFAYGLGYLFLAQDLPIWIGFVMLMVTPCTDWYLVFTGMAKGNLSLSTAILPINLLLQVLLLPLYLLLFFGQSGNIALAPLLESMLLVLVIPFALALLLKTFIKPAGFKANSFLTFFETGQVLFLALAVTAMFASEGKNLMNHPNVIIKLLPPILLFFSITFVLSQVISKLFRFSYADKVSLVLTTMARNSPISLAIAVTAFAHEPLIALSLVIGPLIELPVLTFATQVLLKTKKNIQ